MRAPIVHLDTTDTPYDNETGKGDHRHVRGREMPYEFKSIEQLRRDFERDVKTAGGKDEKKT